MFLKSCLLASLCAILSVQGGYYMDIQEKLLQYDSLEIIHDQNTITIQEDDGLYILKDILIGSHMMPAFGVSIDAYTQEALSRGTWLKFNYLQTQTVEDMPFDTLLIELKPDDHGFTIIRGNDGKYEGRCYYVDLGEKSAKDLFSWAVTTINTQTTSKS